MQYLVGQLLTCLLVAGLFGLAIGWLIWGMIVRNLREHSADLEQRVSKLTGYPARLTDLEAAHAAFIASKNEEAAKGKARIAQLEPLAARAPELEKRLAAKTAEWEVLRAQIEGKTSEIATWQAKLSDLESRHRAEIAEHVEAHADKDVRLASLGRRVTELEPELTAQVKQHEAAHAAKDSHIADLTAKVEQLESALAEKNSHIEDLTARMERPVAAAHADSDEHIAELVAVAALVPELKAKLDEKDAHVGALVSRLESTEYEHNLTNRKLHMAKASVAAHEAEAARLHDQILMHREQPVPPKAMAAAASASAIGFYDVNEGSAAEVAMPAVPQDHVLQFEKRIEELRNIESSKDAELATLRSKLAELEAAPDADAKRQILFTAKNAELTQLRGVLNSLFLPINQDEIALRAYNYAKDRGFQEGSATEDWLRAERDAHHNRLAAAWESTRGGPTMF